MSVSLLSKRLSGKLPKPLFFAILVFLTLMLSIGIFTNTAYAAIDVYEFDNPQQEAQYRKLIAEFRCPKCQNQNLAGSDSQISQDLKRKTYQLVMAGQTDAQIRDYMHERYGDFISYKPPVRPSTWILWFLPPLILVGLISWWLWRSAKNGRVANKAELTDKEIGGVDSNSNVIASHSSSESELSTHEAQELQALLDKHGTHADDAKPSE